jgi:Lon protease-like protein
VTGQRISIFPLAGAVLFPGMQLPLHIFEPRYRAMISDSLARDRLIGMIQPREAGFQPPIYDVGCLGKIEHVQALEDGRFRLTLTGQCRFRVIEELQVTTPFRQVRAELFEEKDDEEVLAPAARAALEDTAKKFSEHLGYTLDWSVIEQLDDATLVNAIAQVAPFDVASKQGLLEANGLIERAEHEMQLMQFYSRTKRGGDGPGVMQ